MPRSSDKPRPQVATCPYCGRRIATHLMRRQRRYDRHSPKPNEGFTSICGGSYTLVVGR